MRNGHRRRGAAAVSALLAAATGLVASSAPAGATNVYGTAGYAVPANVTSLRAEWRIPAIAPGSSLGHGRTYIRATYPPSGVSMEVGTTEDEVLYHGHDVAVYSAFWNRIGFGPQRLRALHAGDLIEAAAVKGTTNWQLTIEDLTTHWKDSVANPGVAATTITGAAWLQEDPVATPVSPAGEQSPVLPYPRIGPVTFTHVSLNGRRATLPWSDALDMMLPGGADVVPTHQSPVGFSVVPANHYQRQYLADAVVLDFAALSFNHVIANWTSATDGPARYRSATQYLTAVGDYVHELSRQRWPPAARADVRSLIASERRVIGRYDELPSVSRAQLAGWQAATASALKANVALAQRVRRDLALPLGA